MYTSKLKMIIGFIGAIVLFAACTGKYVTQPYVAPPPPGYEYKLSVDVQPIFDSKCANCHTASLEPDLRSGYSYNSLTNGGFIKTSTPESSKIYTVMATGGSMSSHCTQADADKVLSWIKQGAKNN